MTDELPEVRKSHPYLMYEMLKDTPDGIRSTLKAMEKFPFDALKSPLYFTGNGTAYHSSLMGAQVLTGSRMEWHVVQAYELEKYMHPEGTVIGVSHTGKTKSTVDAVRKARESATTVGITHYADSPLVDASDHAMAIGNGPDRSLCNTKTFFDNVFAVMSIVNEYGVLGIDIKGLASKVIRAISDLDEPAAKIAEELGDVNRIFVLGAGPNYVSAREAAQKIKESTHLHAEGIELEEFNHGCTAVIDDETLVIIVETPTVRERSQDIVRACREVGTRTVVLNGQGDYTIQTPEEKDEYLAPVISMVALYYLAYHLAVVKGINPDYLRFEDEAYLNYDNVVFPPGAH